MKSLCAGQGRLIAIKSGIGPGSICTTRIVTGGGRAQITAMLKPRRFRDGRHPGDCRWRQSSFRDHSKGDCRRPSV